MKSKIEWTDRTWNPVRGCSRVSEGCRNCYAERQAARFTHVGEPFQGFVESGKWTGKVALVPDKLAEPLSWRKPSRVFVNSMSDLFHEALPDAAIDRVFAVMALAPQHTFQVLTKRPERMYRYTMRRLCYEDFIGLVARRVGPDSGDVDAICEGAWGRYHDGLPNVWLGVSVEDQATADERIPHLLATPAAVRFVSYEPALGPVDFGYTFSRAYVDAGGRPSIDWLIVGGESGPGARPCDVAWIRSAVAQGKAAGVACFVKQLGARPVVDHPMEPGWLVDAPCSDRKGGDPSEWPEDLRVREFPR